MCYYLNVHFQGQRFKTHDVSEEGSAFVFRRNVERKESTSTGCEKGTVTMQVLRPPLTDIDNLSVSW